MDPSLLPSLAWFTHIAIISVSPRRPLKWGFPGLHYRKTSKHWNKN